MNYWERKLKKAKSQKNSPKKERFADRIFKDFNNEEKPSNNVTGK